MRGEFTVYHDEHYYDEGVTPRNILYGICYFIAIFFLYSNIFNTYHLVHDNDSSLACVKTFSLD